MIEVLFGESEADSMKIAKNSSEAWGRGTVEEVICLGFILDAGDIREPVDSLYRKKFIYSILWEHLVKENSPLRSVVNGAVLGVPEHFYDFQIFERLTEQPVKEVRLLGDILGYSQISVGDWWYAKPVPRT